MEENIQLPSHGNQQPQVQHQEQQQGERLLEGQQDEQLEGQQQPDLLQLKMKIQDQEDLWKMEQNVKPMEKHFLMKIVLSFIDVLTRKFFCENVPRNYYGIIRREDVIGQIKFHVVEEQVNYKINTELHTIWLFFYMVNLYFL